MVFKEEKEVVQWVEQFGMSKGVRTLDPLRAILAELGDLHLKLKTVHIAGTNGKGSTVTCLCHMLMAAGLRVGTFTSPYITHFGERLSVNQQSITTSDLITVAQKAHQILAQYDSDRLSTFDVLTLLSFLYFTTQNVDVVIYETGIGGRLDSTNVLTPLVCAITNVGNDHAEILGATQAERAMEKLGIVKPGVALFTTEEDATLLLDFKARCQKQQAELYEPLKKAELVRVDATETVFHFDRYKNVKLNLHGAHQYKNATLALALFDHLSAQGHFPLRKEAAYAGLKEVKFAGRFEQVSKRPFVVLDGAHNEAGMAALVDVVRQAYPHRKTRFLFGANRLKDYEAMLRLLLGVTERLICTKSVHPDSVDPAVLATAAARIFPAERVQVVSDFKQALRRIAKEDDADTLNVVCGSLYLVSEVRAYLLKESGEDDGATVNCKS